MEAALMSRPLPVLPPLLRPVHKPATTVGGELASARRDSRLANTLMQKLDHLDGAGSVTAGSANLGGTKPSAVLSKAQPPRQGLTAHVDSAATLAMVTEPPGLHPQPGTHVSPAAAATVQPIERAPVKSMMGTEASKLAARLAKLTGEAGVQLSTGRLPATLRSSSSPVPPARPGSANRAGLRPTNASPSRDVHR